MNLEKEDAAVILGICIPVNPSKQTEDSLQMTKESTISSHYCRKPSEVLFHTLPFYHLPTCLDPNLGILGKLPSSNILYEKSTFNCWNIEPHFLQVLPLSTADPCERSILVFGGLNPCSVLNKEPSDFGHEDFVLGSTIFQYLLKTEIWKYYGTMIEPRCYHACALHGQYVYVTGGYSLLKREHGEMLAIPSTDRLNLEDRQWKRCANMITARATHAIISHKSFLYVFGGRCSQGKILSSVEIYNPDQDVWAEIISIPQPTMGLCATLTADTIWIFGGITSHSSEDFSKCLLSDVYSFTPSIERWNKEISLPYPCAFSSCVSNEQSLWLIGGCTFKENSQIDTMVSCSSFLQLSLTEKPSRWKSVTTLLNPRHAMTAVLHDECIYVLGGMETNNNRASTVVEVINTRTNTNKEFSSIPVPIAGCTSVIINQNLSFHLSRKGSKHHIQGIYDAVLDLPLKDSFFDVKKDDYSQESIKTFSMSDNIYDINKKVYDSSNKLQLDNNKSFDSFHERSADSKESITDESLKKASLKQDKLIDKELVMTSLPTEEEKTNDSQSVQYRASMEIFLNSNLVDNERSSYVVSKKSSSALKWLKFFDTLSVSDEELHKEVFESEEPQINLKTEVDDRSKSDGTFKKTAEVKYFEKSLDVNKLPDFKSSFENSDCLPSACISDAVPSRQKAFMYVQSNLKSQSLVVDSSVKGLQEKHHIKSAEKVSSPETTNIKPDNLDAPTYTDKIDINEDSFPLILVMGGEHAENNNKSRLILSYYCDENIWEYAGSMPEHRCHHSVIYLKDKLYVIGGFQAATSRLYENITKKVLCYNIYDEMWHEIDNMNYARAYHSTVLMDDEIYVLGGRDESGNILTSVEAYNESKNEWRECKSLPYPVLGAAADTVNDVLYVFGGITYEDENEIISIRTSIFDLQNNSWLNGSDMHIPLAFCGITTFANSVWLFGGLKEKKGNIISGRDILKFDIQSQNWSKVAKLSIPRHASVTVSIGTNIYVIGGHSTQDKKEVLICELVDIIKNEVSVKKKLPVSVSGRAGTVIKSINKNKAKI